MEKFLRKFIFMLDALFANKPKNKITIFYNSQKQKARLDFLLNKFQKRSVLIRRIDCLRRVLSLFKNEGVIYHLGGHPKFHFKKNIIKINSLKDDKKFIRWRNEIKLDYKLIFPYSITTVKQKIQYITFKIFFNEDRNIQFKEKLNLLGYKVLELKIVNLWEILFESFKEGDLKSFNKKFF